MPIFDQGYQHWKGALAGHAWRWLAITRQGVRQQLRRKRTKWLVVAAFAPVMLLSAVLVFWGLLEQQSSLLQPLIFIVQALPEEIRVGPKAYRSAVWTMAFDIFFQVETFFAMLLVLTVGPDLISQDLRFNAIPLYLSRPLRRFDYFAGKLGVIAAFLLTVAVAPAVAAWTVGVAFAQEFSVVRDTWRLLAGSVAYGLIVTVSAGTLMLALSSLSRNSRLVGAALVAYWLIGNAASHVVQDSAEVPWGPLISYTTNLNRIREGLLDVDSARTTFLKLWEAGQDVPRRIFPFRRGSRRRAFDTDHSSEPTPPLILMRPKNLRYPWSWSAGVLAGLFVVSTGILSFRIKSLDRLK